TEECGPDGSLLGDQQKQPLVATAPRGAIVGKIGGSTADLPDTSANAKGPYGGRKAFASGSCTVVELEATDSGPLFLTINDSPNQFYNHAGELWVLIEEAPLLKPREPHQVGKADCPKVPGGVTLSISSKTNRKTNQTTRGFILIATSNRERTHTI